MSLSQPLQQLWGFTISYLLGTLVISVMMAIIFDWPTALGSSLVMLGLFLWGGATCQRLFLQFLPPQWNVQPVSILQFANRDLTLLNAYTQTLENLGFVVLQDYNGGQSNQLVRCFSHPKHHCFVEIGCGFSSDGESRLTHAVFLSVLEAGWTLMDFNQAPSPRESLTYTWRNPREVRRYWPGLTLEQVLAEHLQFREAMLNDLLVYVITNTSWDHYCSVQRELMHYPWQRVRQRHLLVAMVEATQFERRPKMQWLGEYASHRHRD
jgi:hypothetical protein